MIRKSLVLSAIVCSTIGLFGQNLGYKGEKSILGFGARASNGKEIKYNVTPYFFAERSIGLQYSIRTGVSFNNFSTQLNQSFQSVEGVRDEIVLNYTRSSRNVLIENLSSNVTGRFLTMELGLRKYLVKAGAIAPLGSFVEIGFNTAAISVNQFTSYFDIKEGLSLYQLKTEVDNGEANRLFFGGFFSFGEKRFLMNDNFLEYNFMINFYLDDIHWRHTSLITAAQDAIRTNVLSRSFIHLNLIYGFAF